MLEQMTGRLDFHAQALTLRSQRQQVLASNIANADTPGYVARDFDFAAALKSASGSGTGQAVTTDARHFSSVGAHPGEQFDERPGPFAGEAQVGRGVPGRGPLSSCGLSRSVHRIDPSRTPRRGTVPVMHCPVRAENGRNRRLRPVP